MVSLETYKLLQLTLRLLPSHCIISFSIILLIMRTRTGMKKTRLDTMAFFLIQENDMKAMGFRWSLPVVAAALAYVLLAFGVILMVGVLLQMAGLNIPACLFQFYPNYKSQGMKKKKVANNTVNLVLGLCICLFARFELTDGKKQILATTISKAMLGFKLERIQNILVSHQKKPRKQVSKEVYSIHEIQGNFSCCGLNSYQDYLIAPKPVNATWEDVLFYGGVLFTEYDLSKYPSSCCMTTEAGLPRECNSITEMHKFGCYSRLIQFLYWRQAVAEHWSFYIGVCVAAIGGMTYWVQIM